MFTTVTLGSTIAFAGLRMAISSSREVKMILFLSITFRNDDWLLGSRAMMHRYDLLHLIRGDVMTETIDLDLSVMIDNFYFGTSTSASPINLER
jgi:hypothetical protein